MGERRVCVEALVADVVGMTSTRASPDAVRTTGGYSRSDSRARTFTFHGARLIKRADSRYWASRSPASSGRAKRKPCASST
jgi:hypothetical protein